MMGVAATDLGPKAQAQASFRGNWRPLKRTLLASTALILAGVGYAPAETINNASRTITTPTTYNDRLFIATTGTASLTIQAGGTVTQPNYGDIGQQAGSNGTVLVTGTGSAWNNGSSVTSGDAGVGSLTIQNGGTVNATRTYAGYASTGVGTIMVDGTGSSLNGNSLTYIGYSGNGTLTIQNGGLVNNTEGRVGQNAGSVGSVLVTGENSRWASTSFLTVGYDGRGTVLVENGGTITSYTGIVGYHANSVGNFTLSGAGSSWTSRGDITAGDAGTGTILVQNGATVSGRNTYVNYSATGVGSLTVTGAGSTWTSSENITVGNAGTGTVLVQNGATVSGQNTYVAYAATGVGSLTVTGAGSTWTSSEDITVGNAGTGTVLVQNGATVSGQNTYVAYAATSVGSVTVTGAGSAWTSSQNTIIGVDGQGSLTLSNGGTVNSFDTADPSVGVFIASNVGSSGKLIFGADAGQTAVAPGTLNAPFVQFLDGTGSIIFNHTASDFVFAPDLWGTGTVSVLAGKTILTGDSSNFEGITSIASGATLQVGNGGTTGVLAGDIVANGALVFDRAGRLTYDGAISGTGTLSKTGTGKVTLTGDSGNFAGAVSVTQGTLVINGQLGNSTSTLSVGSGGILGGSGRFGGSVTIANGTIAPGNSPGTLTIGGNFLQQAGSTYAVEVVPGTAISDRIIVGGTATIANGAVLNVSKWTSGTYPLNARYTVLTAEGGVSGTYQVTGDTSLSAFYNLIATYDANAVYLQATQTRAFADAGVTPNQKAVAAGLQTLGDGNPLRSLIAYYTSDSEAQAAFDALSGEIHASIAGAMVESSGILRGGAVNRLRAAFGSAGASSATVVPCAKADTAGQLAINCPAVWSEAYGAWGNTNGNGNAAGLSSNIGGFMIGADQAVFDTWRVGLLGGYSASSYTVGNRASSGSSDNYSFGAYGGSQWGKVGLRFGAIYTWSDVDTDRSAVFPGFAEALSSSYQAGTAQVFGDLGYRMDAGPVAFEPFAGLAYVNVATEAYTEQGGIAALSSASNNTGVTFSTLGLRASSSFSTGGIDLTASGSLGWRHAWGDVTPTSTFTLAGSAPFSVSGVPVATDAALVEAGLTVALSRNSSLDISYNGEFGDGVQLQGARGVFAFKF